MRKTIPGWGILFLILFVLLLSFQGCKKKAEEKKEPEGTTPKGRITFGQPVQLTEKGNVHAPDLAADVNGGVHIAYLLQFGAIHRVYYVRSDDDGGTFSNIIQLSDKDGDKSNGVTMTDLGDRLIASWTNRTDVGTVLDYRESSDGGQTFSWETAFSAAKKPMEHDITGSSTEADIFYTYKSDDQAVLALNRNFDPAQEVDILGPGNIHGVKALTSGNTIYVLTEEHSELGGGGKFILLVSTDGAKSFDKYELFGGDIKKIMSGSYNIATTRQDKTSRVHIIWTERDGEGVKLMYAHSMDKITEWSEPVAMASAPTINEWVGAKPLLASDSSQSLIIVYAYLNRDDDSGYRLAYRFSENGGDEFLPETMATDKITSPEVITGALTQKGTVHIAWDDEDYYEPGQRRIYYLKGTVK